MAEPARVPITVRMLTSAIPDQFRHLPDMRVDASVEIGAVQRIAEEESGRSHAARFSVDSQLGVDLDRLRRLVDRGGAQVLHFGGHGMTWLTLPESNGRLVLIPLLLSSSNTRAGHDIQLYDSDALLKELSTRLQKRNDRTPFLFVLMGCETSVFAKSLVEHMPWAWALAWHTKLLDAAAVVFSKNFYSSLFSAMESELVRSGCVRASVIEFAFNIARQSLATENFVLEDPMARGAAAAPEATGAFPHAMKRCAGIPMLFRGAHTSAEACLPGLDVLSVSSRLTGRRLQLVRSLQAHNPEEEAQAALLLREQQRLAEDRRAPAGWGQSALSPAAQPSAGAGGAGSRFESSTITGPRSVASLRREDPSDQGSVRSAASSGAFGYASSRDDDLSTGPAGQGLQASQHRPAPHHHRHHKHAGGAGADNVYGSPLMMFPAGGPSPMGLMEEEEASGEEGAGAPYQYRQQPGAAPQHGSHRPMVSFGSMAGYQGDPGAAPGQGTGPAGQAPQPQGPQDPAPQYRGGQQAGGYQLGVQRAEVQASLGPEYQQAWPAAAQTALLHQHAATLVAPAPAAAGPARGGSRPPPCATHPLEEEPLALPQAPPSQNPLLVMDLGGGVFGYTGGAEGGASTEDTRSFEAQLLRQLQQQAQQRGSDLALAVAAAVAQGDGALGGFSGPPPLTPSSTAAASSAPSAAFLMGDAPGGSSGGGVGAGSAALPLQPLSRAQVMRDEARVLDGVAAAGRGGAGGPLLPIAAAPEEELLRKELSLGIRTGLAQMSSLGIAGGRVAVIAPSLQQQQPLLAVSPPSPAAVAAAAELARVERELRGAQADFSALEAAYTERLMASSSSQGGAGGLGEEAEQQRWGAQLEQLYKTVEALQARRGTLQQQALQQQMQQQLALGATAAQSELLRDGPTPPTAGELLQPPGPGADHPNAPDSQGDVDPTAPLDDPALGEQSTPTRASGGAQGAIFSLFEHGMALLTGPDARARVQGAPASPATHLVAAAMAGASEIQQGNMPSRGPAAPSIQLIDVARAAGGRAPLGAGSSGAPASGLHSGGGGGLPVTEISVRASDLGLIVEAAFTRDGLEGDQWRCGSCTAPNPDIVWPLCLECNVSAATRQGTAAVG